MLLLLLQLLLELLLLLQRVLQREFVREPAVLAIAASNVGVEEEVTQASPSGPHRHLAGCGTTGHNTAHHATTDVHGGHSSHLGHSASTHHSLWQRFLSAERGISRIVEVHHRVVARIQRYPLNVRQLLWHLLCEYHCRSTFPRKS